MEVQAPSDFKSFLDIYETYSNSGDCFYRGQSDFTWRIIPGISRETKHRSLKKFQDIEVALLEKFKSVLEKKKLKQFIPILKKSYHSSWLYLMAGQHYGLPTRLLDFTNNKNSALEFAITEIHNLDKDGAFIVYKNPNKLFVPTDSKVFSRSFKLDYDSFFLQAPVIGKKTNNESFLSERRKGIQGSKFLYRDTIGLFDCLSTDKTHTGELVKIKIPKSIKLKLIQYLIDKGDIAYDQYVSKTSIDNWTAILKEEFYSIKAQTVKRYLKPPNENLKFSYGK